MGTTVSSIIEDFFISPAPPKEQSKLTIDEKDTIQNFTRLYKLPKYLENVNIHNITLIR